MSSHFKTSLLKVALLSGYGVNSDYELEWCFQKAGFQTERIHINDFIHQKKTLLAYQVLALPGGFSFGDHIASGKVFSNLLKFKLRDQLQNFLKKKRPIIGICNGFQILVKSGILSSLSDTNFEQKMTLISNNNGLFEDRWVNLVFNPNSPCIWTQGIKTMRLPIRHGEGRFYCDEEEIKKIKSFHGDPIRYGKIIQKEILPYPVNPNGSLENIAGICSKDGLMLGLMPHPEACRIEENNPNWTRIKSMRSLDNDSNNKQNYVGKIELNKGEGQGMAFFHSCMNYFEG